MERIVALKRLRKLLGNELGYRINPKAPDADEREEAKAKLPALITARRQVEKAMQDRRRELLEDRTYQELVAAHGEACKLANEAMSLCHSYKFTVGKSVAGLFFHVKAQGDSWEEVIKSVTPTT